MKNYLNFVMDGLMTDKTLISVYNDPQDPEGFVIGRILDMDQSHYMLSELNPWGEPDGIRIHRMDQVIQILHGEEYEMRLELLMAFRNQQFKEFYEEGYVRHNALLLDVLETCRKTGEIVTFIIGDDAFTGRISECNDLHTTLRMFDFFASQTSDEVFSLREIEIVQLRSPEEAMYSLLEQNQPTVPHLV